MRDVKGVVASVASIPGAGAGMTKGFDDGVNALCYFMVFSGDRYDEISYF